MSGITQVQAQAQLDSLLEQQASMLSSVSISGRTVTNRQLQEVQNAINYWSRIVSGFQREADGHCRHGFKAANFQNTQ